MSDESKSLDVLGLKSYGEAINTATKGVMEGAGAFLSRICNPAAEELGLLFKDRVSHWRGIQASRIAEKAERKLQIIPGSGSWRAHPRIVGQVIERGSWEEADEVQEMWAGLLASSCTPEGKDDENLMFVDLLSSMSKSQALILMYACNRAPKRIHKLGTVTVPEEIKLNLRELSDITGVHDVHKLDRELDHLRVLGLLDADSGFPGIPPVDDKEVQDEDDPFICPLRPTDLALQMYVRCQGSREYPARFFKLG